MSGARSDAIIMRLVDAMLAIPFLILAIALAAFLGPSLTNAMIAIGIAQVPIFARLMRGQVLAVKEEDYIEAADAIGNPHRRIVLRHIFPNAMPPILVQATLAAATAIIAEASLSFLGLGQQPPNPSWGSMLNTARSFMSQAPWMAVWPGMAIFSAGFVAELVRRRVARRARSAQRMREKPWPSVACLWLRELTGATAAISDIGEGRFRHCRGSRFPPARPAERGRDQDGRGGAARGGICR